jgi:hypothetical protein
MLGFYGFLKPEACLPQARDAATRAITLNPSLGETLTSMAMSISSTTGTDELRSVSFFSLWN